MARRLAAGLLILAAAPASVRAQVTAGPVLRVNTYTTNSQAAPTLAMDPAGNFVVTWGSFRQDGGSFGVFAQRFDAEGVPRGAEFRVNSYTTGSQGTPAVALDARGNFVVAWSSVQDGSATGVFAQR